jgi:hypothetical protein
MNKPFLSFVCTVCGPQQEPCEHFENWMLRKEFKFLNHAVLEILHLLNRPFSATLKFEGTNMPKTIAPGETASSLFQEWTGPSGTGDVVPNAGAIAYTSDNTAVATVDPASGVATGVADGTANITGTDQANNLTASDVLTVFTPPPPPPVAVSATLTLQ